MNSSNSYSDEFNKKKSQTKMKDRDAYILLLEEKLKHTVTGGSTDLRDRLNEALVQLSSLDGKVAHLTKLHELNQDLIETEEQEYTKDKSKINERIDKVEEAVGQIYEIVQSLTTQHNSILSNKSMSDREGHQGGGSPIDRLEEEVKWIKKRMNTRITNLSDSLTKELRLTNERERQSLMKLEELANILQQEIHNREAVHAELESTVRSVRDTLRKSEDQIIQQEIRLQGKFKNLEDNVRSEFLESIKIVKDELSHRCGDLEVLCATAEKQSLMIKENFQKISTEVLNSHHALSDTHSQIQRDTQEMLQDTKKERAKIHEDLRQLSDERMRIRTFIEGESEKGNELSRGLKEELDRMEKNLEHSIDDVTEQIAAKQKNLEKVIQRQAQSFESAFEELKERFNKEMSAKLDSAAEASKAEKRSNLRVEDIQEQIASLSDEVHSITQNHGKVSGSFEQRIRENFMRMVDEIRTNNEENLERLEKTVRRLDTQGGDCLHKVSRLMELHKKAQAEIQEEFERINRRIEQKSFRTVSPSSHNPPIISHNPSPIPKFPLSVPVSPKTRLDNSTSPIAQTAPPDNNQKRVFNVKSSSKTTDKPEKSDRPYSRHEMNISELNATLNSLNRTLRKENIEGSKHDSFHTKREISAKSTKAGGPFINNHTPRKNVALSPRFSKFQNPLKKPPKFPELDTSKKGSRTSGVKDSGKKPGKGSGTFNLSGGRKDDAFSVSSPDQEKHTQRRLRDLYRELKALDYDDED